MTTEFIKKELKKYNITDAEIAKASKECLQLVVVNASDIVNYNIVKQARIGIKAKRVEVEKRRKELKSESLSFGRAVDNEAKRIFALIDPIEKYLISQEKIVDDEKQRIKDEKIRLEREQLEREEEERQVKIREEEERLNKQRIEQDEKAKELQEKQDRIDAANLKIQREMEWKAQQKQHLAKIKEAEENARIEVEEKVEREKAELRLKEVQDKIDDSNRIAQLPDKERIHLYAESLKAIGFPAISNTKMQEKFVIGKAMVIDAYKYFKSI